MGFKTEKTRKRRDHLMVKINLRFERTFELDVESGESR